MLAGLLQLSGWQRRQRRGRQRLPQDLDGLALGLLPLGQELLVVLGLLVPLLLDLRVLGWGLATAGHHPRILGVGLRRRAGADQPDAEVPLIAVVEQEQEFLAGGGVTDVQPVSCPSPPAIIRRRRPGILSRAVPRLAAEEERPQVRVVEAEGERDRLAQVAERLAASQLELAPDLPAIGWGVHATKDPRAKRVGSRGDR